MSIKTSQTAFNHLSGVLLQKQTFTLFQLINLNDSGGAVGCQGWRGYNWAAGSIVKDMTASFQQCFRLSASIKTILLNIEYFWRRHTGRNHGNIQKTWIVRQSKLQEEKMIETRIWSPTNCDYGVPAASEIIFNSRIYKCVVILQNECYKESQYCITSSGP